MATYITAENIYLREPLFEDHSKIIDFWVDRSDNQLLSMARTKGVYSVDSIETDPLDSEIIEYLELWVIENSLLGSGGNQNINAVDLDEDAYLGKLKNFYEGGSDKQAAKISYGMLIGSVDEPVKSTQVYNRIR